MSTPTGQDEQWRDLLHGQGAYSEKNWFVTLFLSVLLGIFGADRLYLEQYALAMFKLLSFGGCFIWWGIDVILLVAGQMKDADGKIVKRP